MEPLPPLEVITRENAHKVKLLTVLSFGYFTGLAWSPDEKNIAVATSKGIWLHEADDLKKTPQQLQATIRKVNGVAFSSDSRLLASAESDGVVRVWAMDTRTLRMELHGHDGEVMSVKFSPDGTRLFSGGSDSTVRVWDLASGTQITTLICQTELSSNFTNHIENQGLSFLVLSPDGNTLIACGKQSNIFLYDANSWQRKGVISLRYWGIVAIGFTTDGKTLIVRTALETHRGFHFWNIDTESPDDTITYSFLNFQPVNEKGIWQLSYGSGYRSYTLTNTKTGQNLINPVLETRTSAYAKNRSRSIHLFYGGRLEIWDGNLELPNGRPLQTSTVSYHPVSGSMEFSPDGMFILVKGHSHGPCLLWDVRTQQPARVIESPHYEGNIISTLFSPNGRLIYVATSQDGHIYVGDVLKQQRLVDVEGHARNRTVERITAILSPDWKKLASGSEDGIVKIWDLSSRKHKIIWRQTGQKVGFGDFSSDGEHIAFISDEVHAVHILNTLHVVNLKTRQEIITIKPAHKTTFSPDGTTLFVISRVIGEGDVIQLWDVYKKTPIGRLATDLSAYVYKPSFTSDGSLAIIPLHKTVEIWDWRNQKKLASLEESLGDYIMGLASSPDGKLIAVSSGHGGEIHLLGIPAN